MSRAELIQAFEMRLEGKTWDEIGYELHFDESFIRKQIQKIVNRQYLTEKEDKKDENKLQ